MREALNHCYYYGAAEEPPEAEVGPQVRSGSEPSMREAPLLLSF